MTISSQTETGKIPAARYEQEFAPTPEQAVRSCLHVVLCTEKGGVEWAMREHGGYVKLAHFALTFVIPVNSLSRTLDYVILPHLGAFLFSVRAASTRGPLNRVVARFRKGAEIAPRQI